MLQVWALEGIPEIVAGDDLAVIIGNALEAGGTPEDGDILCVTSKILSKAERRMVRAADREDAITAETVRVVASREHPGGVTRIVENRLGIVAAAAGVDSSNTPEGTVLLLPVDPDASAHAIAAALRDRFGVRLGVVVSDTLGRPWREGQTDVAIGAAGIHVLHDLRGSTDAAGRVLGVTMPAVADEIAGAADLVKGKASGLPVAVVRGLGHLVGGLELPGARSIVRPADHDMFRLGTAEARAEGYDEGYAAGYDEGSAEAGDTTEVESDTAEPE
jgi:coenzyme F420-0:L-glutamate ligase/coenzyme F420-1:gamma-L-glutamate ligase